MPEATPPAAAPAAPAAPVQAQAPDRAAARKARIDGVKAKGVDNVAPVKAPAAADTAKPPAAKAEPAAAAPAVETPKPAAPAAPAKPKSELERLYDEARRLAAPAAPAPKPKAPVAPAPVAAATPVAVDPQTALRASIYKMAAENNADPTAMLRHYVEELKAGRPLPFTTEPGREIFDPARQRLDAADKNYTALRAELDELKNQNTQLRQTWEQQQASAEQARQSSFALAQVKSDAARWPLLNRAKDSEAVATRILSLVDVAAKNQDAVRTDGKQIKDLTLSDIVDIVEKEHAEFLSPYKDYFAPAAPAAPSHPQPAAKTDGQVTTIAPGSVSPQAGELPARRRDARSRSQRGIDFLHSGK